MPLHSVNMKCELEIVDRTQSNQNSIAYLQDICPQYYVCSMYSSRVVSLLSKLIGFEV